VVEDQHAFAARCAARLADYRDGTGYGFGLFANGTFTGEINISQVFRGALQSCSAGYWVAETHAGNGYVPEGMVLAMRFIFEELGLHRLEIGIIPRNAASLRVPEKLGLRYEGLAERLVEINGVWEDHYRFGITFEEWVERREELLNAWVY
jgi:ribosomal-protein-alanine N-acetyltransferase